MKVKDLVKILEENPDCLLCTELLTPVRPVSELIKYPAYLSDFYVSKVNPCNKDVFILGFYYDTPDYIVKKYSASEFLKELKKALLEDDFEKDVWCTISNLQFNVIYPDPFFAQSRVEALKLLDIPDKNRCKLFVEYSQDLMCG